MTATLHTIATPITATRLAMYRNGYHPVPIIGPHVKTNSAGKRPQMSDWQTICLTADEPMIESWEHRQGDCTNSGMLCGTLSGVDIDVMDHELSELINAKALEMLGPTPLKRIGLPPKTLLCYRLVEAIGKKTTPALFFTDDITNEKATKVEIMGEGQQVVAFGIHPDTHREYHWPDQSPLDVRVDDLPLVTAEALTAFIEEAEHMLRHAGGRTKAEVKAGEELPTLVPADAISEARRPGADVRNLTSAPMPNDMPDKVKAAYDNVLNQNRLAHNKPSRDLIVSALAAVPNDLDYDTWIKMGYALRDGLGVGGIDVWTAYSEQHAANTAAVTEAKWKSFANRKRVTINTLFWLARKNGWRYPGTEWTTDLKVNVQKVPKPLLVNVVIALRQSPDWMGSLSHNAFTLEASLDVPPPWHTDLSPAASRDDDDKQTDWTPRVWGPHDDLCLTDWMQHQGIAISPNQAAQAVEMVARDRIVHPVLDYLDGLKHDGGSRVDTWLTEFLGAEDSPYIRSVGRAMLIAAVARIRDPGCKVDTVPILEGPQGALKSTAIKKLFHPWFTDELADLGSKDAAMQMSGIWGIEMAELDAMGRAENSRTKAFISRTADRFRPPYGQRLVERPRACVFWGTTNAEGYLKDETGGRRSWPVKVGKIDLGELAANRDQLWAEAQALYSIGTPWWITDQAIQVAAEDQQQDRYQGDAWDGEIAAYVTRMDERDITIADILKDLGLPIDRCGQVEMNRVARVLRSLGLCRRQRGSGTGRRWIYSNPARTFRTERPSADIVPFYAKEAQF